MNIGRAALVAVRGLGLALLAMLGSLVSFIFSVVFMALSLVGVGLFVTPVVTAAVPATVE